MIVAVMLFGVSTATSAHATPIAYEEMLAPSEIVNHSNSIFGGGFLDLGRPSEMDC